MRSISETASVIHRIIAVCLAKRVVRAHVITLLCQGAPLLHEGLRSIKTRAAKMQLIFGVRRIGSYGQREFLRRFLPLLGRLVLQTLS